MELNLTFWLSLVLAASSCFGLILAGRGRWQGWAVGLATQPVWATYAILTEGYGLLLTCLMFGTVYTKNLLKWRKSETDKTDAKSEKVFVNFVTSGLMSPNEIRVLQRSK